MPLFTPVRPVPAQPPQFSLVRAALTPPEAEQGWENGFSWRPERCITSVGYGACDTGELPEALGTALDGLNYHVPNVLRTEDECSTLYGLTELDEGRVRRQLEAVTPYRVARELWSGEITQAHPYATPESGGVANVTNRQLAQEDGVEVHEGIHEPLDGLGVLEELARRSLGGGSSQGQDVWIHLPLEVMPLVEGHLMREGNRWYSKGGAVVVVDAGYLGTAPDGTAPAGARWIYATGPVTVRLSPIRTETLINQRANRRVAVAERVAAASFDDCVHHGLAVAVPPTT